MGAIGERKLQELIDRAAWEVANGTPQDIASRGLFDACAEVLEGNEKLQEERDELAKQIKEYEKATLELRALVKSLLGDDVCYGEPEASDLTDVYKALAGKIGELGAAAQDGDARIKALEALNDGQTIAVRERDEIIERLREAGRAAEARGDELEERATAALARAAELEKLTGDAPKWLERNEYLETGLKRVMIEMDKLRKGVL